MATWPALAPFRHYEEFWRIHLVQLRSTGSIHPRPAAGSMTTFNPSPCSITLCMSLWEKPTNESWGRKHRRSGAFLFAALNILERLYDSCLVRMQAFVDDHLY
jgi:hypothetical protein